MQAVCLAQICNYYHVISRSTEWNLRWLNHWIGFTFTITMLMHLMISYICQSRSIHTRHHKYDGLMEWMERNSTALQNKLLLHLRGTWGCPPPHKPIYTWDTIYTAMNCALLGCDWKDLRLHLFGEQFETTIVIVITIKKLQRPFWTIFYSPPWWSSVPAPDSKHTHIWFISVMDEILLSYPLAVGRAKWRQLIWTSY